MKSLRFIRSYWAKPLEMAQLHSTHRSYHRAYRSLLRQNILQDQYNALIVNIGKAITPRLWPEHSGDRRVQRRGATGEAPRGMLSRTGWWLKTVRIGNYRAVDAIDTNSGRVTSTMTQGPYEQSLVGTPIADRQRSRWKWYVPSLLRPLHGVRGAVVDADKQ